MPARPKPNKGCYCEKSDRQNLIDLLDDNIPDEAVNRHSCYKTICWIRAVRVRTIFGYDNWESFATTCECE